MLRVLSFTLLVVASQPGTPGGADEEGEEIGARLDVPAVEAALNLRLGPDRGGWRFDIDPDLRNGRARVVLTSPAGTEIDRAFVLAVGSDADRARELAAALVLLTETWVDEPEPEPEVESEVEQASGPDPEPDPEPKPRGPWVTVGLEGAASFNAAPDLALEVGPDLHLGALFLDGLVHVRGLGGWARAPASDLTIDRWRMGLGIAVGTELPSADRWWLGAYAASSAIHNAARGDRAVSAWTSVHDLAFAARWQPHPVFVEMRAGPSFSLPPISVSGGSERRRFGLVRATVVLAVGAVFGR